MNSPAGTTVDMAQPIPTHLGAIWGELDAQITPFIYVLTIPGQVYRSLEQAAKDFVATTFMYVCQYLINIHD